MLAVRSSNFLRLSFNFVKIVRSFTLITPPQITQSKIIIIMEGEQRHQLFAALIQ